jgi:tripeptide aminopeptidase
MNIVERFLNYVTYDTQSSEETGRTPSTEKQRIFAKHLKDELIAEGLQDVELDELGYLYATLLLTPTRKCLPLASSPTWTLVLTLLERM